MDWLIDFAILFAITLQLVIAFNLVLGLSGQLFLGFSGLMSLGSLTTLLLINQYEIPAGSAIIVGALLAMGIGLAIFSQITRLPAPIMALTSLIFVYVMTLLFPILQIGPKEQFSLNFSGTLTLALFIGVIVCLLINYQLENSRFGRALKAIREQQNLAELTGITVIGYKVQALATGFFLAGLAGGFFTFYIGAPNPANFGLLRTLDFLTIIVLGGLGSIPGLILSTFLITAIAKLSLLTPLTNFFLDLGILVCILHFRPTGLLGKIDIKKLILRAINGDGRKSLR